MTPDELVQQILNLRSALDSEIEEDDLNIFVKEDLVIVSALDEPLGMGKTIQAALEDALAAMRNFGKDA